MTETPDREKVISGLSDQSLLCRADFHLWSAPRRQYNREDSVYHGMTKTSVCDTNQGGCGLAKSREYTATGRPLGEWKYDYANAPEDYRVKGIGGRITKAEAELELFWRRHPRAKVVDPDG